MKLRATIGVALLAALNLSAQTNLTQSQAIELALQQNPAILMSRQELRRTHGLIVAARSANLPHLTLTGQYTEIDPGRTDAISLGTNTPSFRFSNQQHPWLVQVEATQPLYTGGRVNAGIRAARLADQIALLDFDRVLADTVLAVRKGFAHILLAQQQVLVHEQSIKLLEQQLIDVRHRFEAGTVPRFNVLRAEVELANARPPLIRSQNTLRLAKEHLVKVLAIDSTDFTTLTFTGSLAQESRPWSLPAALEAARQQRPEIRVAEKQIAIAQEETHAAQAGNKPSVSLFGGYQVRNTQFGNSMGDVANGWEVGLRAQWDIFDGFLTRGQTAQAQAKHRQAEIALAELQRTIALEVRQAYSDHLQAVELLTAQQKTVEQAEESLRLAETRFQSGTGTQLDVLSAQTALTAARSNEIQARYDFTVSVATLERVTGITVKP